MGGPRGETLGVREGGRCDTAALSPQGDVTSPRPSRVSNTKWDKAMRVDDDGHGARPKSETVTCLR